MAAIIPSNRGGKPARPGSFYNMIDDFFGDFWSPARDLAGVSFRLDVKENDEAYTVEADLPNTQKDDIAVDFNDGRLSIAVTRDEIDEQKDERDNYLHRERRYSSMQRSIRLVDGVADGITAKLEDGVLKITVPKDKEAGKTTRIEIQ